MSNFRVIAASAVLMLISSPAFAADPAPLVIHNDRDATVSLGLGGSIRGPVVIYNKNRIIFSVPAGSTISNKQSSR